MQLRSTFLILLLALLLGPVGRLAAQTVQFADGRILLAKVEDADGNGLRVRRLDNGGALDLRWEHLSAASATAIKKQWNLGGESQDEVLVRADEVEYLQNGAKQTLVGKVVERAADHLVLQIKGVPFRIPKAQLQAMRAVDVPATQVYTKDEYYAEKLVEAAPGDQADKHMLLADVLTRCRDYEHAAYHLAKAKDLGNSRDPQRLEAMQQRLQRYQEAAKERELIDQIQAARSRGQLADFEKGMKLVAEYDKTFAQAKLKSEFDLEKKRLLESRGRYLTSSVAEAFRRSIQALADKKVSDPGVTLAQARDYADSKMSDELFARVAQQLHLEVDEVKQLWGGREKFPVGKRADYFSYGIGSWVLGSKAIEKDTNLEKAKGQQAKPQEANTQDTQRILRLMREALQRRNASQAGGEQQEQTDEQWWNSAPRPERTSWLRAYYAENGGQLKVTYAGLQPCVSCQGEGKTLEIGSDGKPMKIKCFLCHGTRWLRSFKAY